MYHLLLARLRIWMDCAARHCHLQLRQRLGGARHLLLHIHSCDSGCEFPCTTVDAANILHCICRGHRALQIFGRCADVATSVRHRYEGGDEGEEEDAVGESETVRWRRAR